MTVRKPLFISSSLLLLAIFILTGVTSTKRRSGQQRSLGLGDVEADFVHRYGSGSTTDEQSLSRSYEWNNWRMLVTFDKPGSEARAKTVLYEKVDIQPISEQELQTILDQQGYSIWKELGTDDPARPERRWQRHNGATATTKREASRSISLTASKDDLAPDPMQARLGRLLEGYPLFDPMERCIHCPVPFGLTVLCVVAFLYSFGAVAHCFIRSLIHIKTLEKAAIEFTPKAPQGIGDWHEHP